MMSQFYNNVKTFLLLSLLTVLILWIGALIGGQQGVLVALVFAAVMNFVSFFFSDKIAIMTMGGQEVGPEHPLYQIVSNLVARAGLPMPRVFVSPKAAPNAFATGRSPRHAAVCATQGLLDMLEPNEVAGVMGHELAHVKHRDILITTVAATIAGAISMLGYMLMWGGVGGDRRRSEGNAIAALLVMILGPIAAGLIQAAISRSREFNADKEGAAICGDPMSLATALEKIEAASQQIPLNVNPAFNSMFIAEPRNLFDTLANLGRTHPPMEARIMNLIGRPTTGRVAPAGMWR